MMFTAVMESVLITVFFVLMTLCWLCENKTSFVVAVWNTIVLIRNFWQVMFKGVYTTAKNEDPVVEEPELADSSGDQTSGSLTTHLVPPSFHLYVPSPQQGDNTARIIDVEEAMRSIIRVVNLTIRREQTVEKALNYFKFILFDLNLGEEMYHYMHCHMLDQLDWWHSNGDSEMEIVGEIFGGFIVQGIRLNSPDYWKMVARMVVNHLENDDIKYLNFAQSALKKLKKDLPKSYLHLIQEMIDKLRSAKRKKKPTALFIPPYAYSYKYL